MRLVAAGARRDQGQLDAAIVTLQSPELASSSVQPWTARLRYAYADALLAAGREDEAREWFGKTLEADKDGATDASDRLAELDGVEFVDAAGGDVIDDEDDEDDEQDAAEVAAAERAGDVAEYYDEDDDEYEPLERSESVVEAQDDRDDRDAGDDFDAEDDVDAEDGEDDFDVTDEVVADEDDEDDEDDERDAGREKA